MRIGLLSLLTVLFIGLKVTNYIAWSWFWVLSPTIFGLALALFLFVVLLIGICLK